MVELNMGPRGFREEELWGVGEEDILLFLRCSGGDSGGGSSSITTEGEICGDEGVSLGEGKGWIDSRRVRPGGDLTSAQRGDPVSGAVPLLLLPPFTTTSTTIGLSDQDHLKVFGSETREVVFDGLSIIPDSVGTTQY